MTAPDPYRKFSLVGQLLRAPEEIARVLNSLVARGEPVTADLGGGAKLFCSRLRSVDPAGADFIVEPSPDASANQALLARSQAMFHAEPGGWQIEFVAAAPIATSPHEGAPGIRMRFPEIIAGHRRRADERADVPPPKRLRCVIDEDGIMPFEGIMTNVSKGGIGFLQYDPVISLEPGTLLKGCRIDGINGESIVLDLEVRYSQRVVLADERQLQSSGCRFLSLSAEETSQIERMFDL